MSFYDQYQYAADNNDDGSSFMNKAKGLFRDDDGSVDKSRVAFAGISAFAVGLAGKKILKRFNPEEEQSRYNEQAHQFFNADGQPIDQLHDANGDLIEQDLYDANGEPVEEDTIDKLRNYFRDEDGSVDKSRVFFALAGAALVGYAGKKLYDHFNPEEEQNKYEQEKQQYYDADGRPIRQLHDANGDLIEQDLYDANGEPVEEDMLDKLRNYFRDEDGSVDKSRVFLALAGAALVGYAGKKIFDHFNPEEEKSKYDDEKQQYYDANGRPIRQLHDANGELIEQDLYDANGEPVEEDTIDKLRNYFRDEDGSVDKSRVFFALAGAALVGYAGKKLYDHFNPEEEQNKYEQEKQQYYDADGRPIRQLHDANGELIEQDLYDANGEPVEEDTIDKLRNYFRDEDGSVDKSRVLFALAGTVLVGYLGKRIYRHFNPEEMQSSYDQEKQQYYDANGRPIRQLHDANGDLIEQDLYDSNGEPVEEDTLDKLRNYFRDEDGSVDKSRVFLALAGAALVGYAGKKIFDHFNPEEEKSKYDDEKQQYYDANGRPIRQLHDANGELIEQDLYDANGEPVEEDMLDKLRNYFRDEDGSVDKSRVFFALAGAALVGYAGKKLYDHFNPEEEQNKYEQEKQQYYDADGRPIRQLHDANGELIEQDLYNANGEPVEEDTIDKLRNYFRDDDGSIDKSRVFFALAGAALVGYTGKQIYDHYNEEEESVEQSQDIQQQAQYYDADGQPIYELYDSNGNLVDQPIYKADGEPVEEDILDKLKNFFRDDDGSVDKSRTFFAFAGAAAAGFAGKKLYKRFGR